MVLAALAVFFLYRGCSSGPQIKEEPRVTVYRSGSGQVETWSLESYIVGTVAAEMPASFELDALKAQAVCARTYALRKLMEGKSYPRGADLSDDIFTCQAFVNRPEFTDLHPRQSEQLWAKITRAVYETRGEVLLYEQRPIDALYHSTCGGQTASALEVWGNEIPYLQSRPCPFCQESRRYQTVQAFSWQQVTARAGQGSKIKVTQTTPTGRIKSIQVNQKTMSGSRFRQVFALPSTWCSIQCDHRGVKITSRGYGHGVGLCQYGAQGMAEKGHDYQEILYHYYPETSVYRLNY